MRRAYVDIMPSILAEALALFDRAGVKVVGSMPGLDMVSLVIESDMLPPDCEWSALRQVKPIIRQVVGGPTFIDKFEVA